MGHLVYPNATHTRFAHSLGVRAIMERILARVNIPDEAKPKLLLAALLHDIGHYPYSLRIPINSDTQSENSRTPIRDIRTVVGA